MLLNKLRSSVHTFGKPFDIIKMFGAGSPERMSSHHLFG